MAAATLPLHQLPHCKQKVSDVLFSFCCCSCPWSIITFCLLFLATRHNEWDSPKNGCCNAAICNAVNNILLSALPSAWCLSILMKTHVLRVEHIPWENLCAPTKMNAMKQKSSCYSCSVLAKSSPMTKAVPALLIFPQKQNVRLLSQIITCGRVLCHITYHDDAKLEMFNHTCLCCGR